MCQLLLPAIFHQQVPPNEVGDTATEFNPLMTFDRAAGLELRLMEHVGDLREWGAIREGQTRQARHGVVPAGDLGGAAVPLNAQKEFEWFGHIMHGDVEGSMACNPDLLRDRLSAVG